jgi:hypothetical protein
MVELKTGDPPPTGIIVCSVKSFLDPLPIISGPAETPVVSAFQVLVQKFAYPDVPM